MSSSRPSYAQPKNNITTVIPVPMENNPPRYDITIDPRFCNVFNVDLAGLTSASGYYVFYITSAQAFAQRYPGLEFTVMFTRHPSDNNRVTVYFMDGMADIITPVDFPQGSVDIIFSLTLRSNGTRFTVVSSGPTSWAYPGPDD